ncbi:S8 family serine peptidase [Actinoplanes sp. NEAU-A12]|uniref:alpha-amylase n=1 Tax=Actinoplanes sandaracinus TaxID=3045177 RepID=A0ABT6WC32_9ACTN|nr:S8 family serine peptidase [Actinoplanes sandaracinus]MDI6097289.1 S8 family serine peptidase [Actinoplanes sandaracinus]
MRQDPSGLRRRGSAALTALALALSTLLSAPAVAAEPTGDPKIDDAVTAAVEGGREASFWVLLRGETDLAPAAKAKGKARAKAVHQAARDSASRSQQGLRKLLTSRKADFTTFWIADTIKVTGDAKLLAEVAKRPEVKAVLPDTPVTLPAPAAGAVRAAVDAVEWNVDRIGAPRLWNERGSRGQGIVIANIDTGVQFDHPALAANYRGRQADGSVSHDYHWFDPARICADANPCDNNGHGTHTMGTMAGAEGIGVAPGATWIAAKGCESNSCSVEALLAAGQWIVAPTDRNGQNPRPELAPDIVNNSWGGAPGFDPWYSDVVRSWVAAGIFPAFSNGNAGPGCNTSGTPGSYTDTYASGATDVNDVIAPFSSRGTGQAGGVKPDITAPGVDVRSSIPGGYASFSGTSMASPHTAAAVALIWSAAPSLRRDITATREILDATAIDTSDTSCGGTADDNNVFGQGRLDAYAAVQSAVSPAGSLTGTVRADGVPLGGVAVSVTGAASRTVTTAADGAYRFARLPAGAYRVRVAAFGYDTFETDVTVTAGAGAVLDAALTASNSGIITGQVTGAGAALPGVTVALTGTPVSVTTGADGRFRLAAPTGAYELTARPLGGCFAAETRSLTVSRDVTLDLALRQITDGYGYACAPATEAYRAGTERLALSGDDAHTEVTLPFAVPLYGVARDRAWISTNGVIGFASPTSAYQNTALPNSAEPNDAFYAFWDDLVVDEEAGVWTSAGADTFVVEWRNVRFFGYGGRISISAILHSDGTVTYRYQDLSGDRAPGLGATIGLENAAGTAGLAYSVDAAAVTEGLGVTFRSGPANRIAATFNVTAETWFGQNVFVAGNLPELGAWDPARAVALGAAGYPVWSGGVTLPPNTAVEFKYLKKDPDGTVTWEPGANRTTVTPPSGTYITHDTFGAH